MIHNLFHFQRIFNHFKYSHLHSQCLTLFPYWSEYHKCFNILCFPKDILHIIISFLEAEELVYCGNIFEPDWNNLLKDFFRKYYVPYVNRPLAKIVLHDTILHDKCIICSSNIFRYPLCHICFDKYMIEDGTFLYRIDILFLHICYIPILLLKFLLFNGLVPMVWI